MFTDEDKQEFTRNLAAFVSDWERHQAAGDLSWLRQRLHTLKGEAFLLGLSAVGETIHAAESHLQENDLAAAQTLLCDIAAELPTVPAYTPATSVQLADVDVLADKWRARWTKVVNDVWAGQTGKKIRFRCDIASLPPLLVSGEWLNAVFPLLDHLLRNAVVHGIEKVSLRPLHQKDAVGNIALTVSVSGNRLTVVVEDDGRGITQPSSPVPVSFFAGRGVGLQAVKDGVAAVGGTVQTDSEANRFTRFTLSLPFVEGLCTPVLLFRRHAERNGLSALPLASVRAFRAHGSGAYQIDTADGGCVADEIVGTPVLTLFRHPFSSAYFGLHRDTLCCYAPRSVSGRSGLVSADIFVVDDSHLARQVLMQFLTRFRPNAVIREFADGADAWQAIKDGVRPKLILCDWEMPLMQGDRLLALLKSHHLNAAFVMVTSRSIHDYRDRILQAGATEFFGKPIDTEALKAVIRRLGL